MNRRKFLKNLGLTTTAAIGAGILLSNIAVAEEVFEEDMDDWDFEEAVEQEYNAYTTKSFSKMLDEYMPNELLKEELMMRDFIFRK